MNFLLLDNILKEYTKCFNQIIYNYYSSLCFKCNEIQIYCGVCELYSCLCNNNINFCNVEECGKILCCLNQNRICSCCNKFLCDRCWNIDIYDDILEDIRINGN
jgi:hypothetical protein